MSISKKQLEMTVQKWIFERGNYQLIFENAWSLKPIYSQERIKTNGEIVRNRIETNSVLLLWRTIFEDTILDASGQLNLKVQWRSGLMTCKCRILIDDEQQSWAKYIENKWIGSKGEWPDQLEYLNWTA